MVLVQCDHSLLKTMRRTKGWGELRQSPTSSQQTQLLRSNSALDSSDEESFVDLQPALERAGDAVSRSAPVPLHPDAPLNIAMDQHAREEAPADAVVRGPNPFRALLVHTNAIWRTDYDPLFTGHIEDGHVIPLFDSSTILETPEHLDLFDEFSRRCYEYDRHHFFVDLFFQMRYHSGHKKRDKRSSPTSLMKAWERFVFGYRESPSFWMSRLRKERERTYNHTTEGAKLRVHQQTIAAGLPCGVRPDQDCPFCYPDSPKLPLKSRYENTLRHTIPDHIRLLMIQLDVRCLDESRDKKEAEEFNEDEDALREEFFNCDATLRMQQQVAASALEIHRMKRQNLMLAKEVRNLKNHSTAIEQRHKQEHEILVDLVQDLSDKVRNKKRKA